MSGSTGDPIREGRRFTRRFLVALTALLGLGSSACARQTPSAQALLRARPGRQVAVTIDDLPIANPSLYRTAQERRRCVEGLTALLRARRLPATGFFNLSMNERHPSLLGLWQEAGVQLGNHTWSHPRLEEVGLAAYVADLEQGHAALQALLPAGTVIPFRYPFLVEGLTVAERDRIREVLRALKSPIAPVTIDASDWLYARGHQRAVASGDTTRRELQRRSWRWNLEESTLLAEHWSRALFGREPPQILLLHGNCLNADHLGEYLDWLTARGYTFVTLDAALRDPAYAEPDRSTSPTGDSHWLRLWRSRSLGATGAR